MTAQFRGASEKAAEILKAIVLALVFLSCTAGWSQAEPGSAASPTRFDVYGGAAFTGSNPGVATKGFNAGVGVRVLPWMAGVFDLSSYFGSNSVADTAVLTDYLVGPRFFAPHLHASRVKPFADVLFGGQSLHNTSTQHSYYPGNGNGIAAAADGGVDLGISRHLAIRGQAGFIYSHFAVVGRGLTGPLTNSRYRAGVGMVYRF